MQLQTLIDRVRAQRETLARLGLRSLTLIQAAALHHPVEALHLLAELDGAWDYARFREVSRTLAALLDRPVEVVLVNSADEAVGPFLDPEAVRIL